MCSPQSRAHLHLAKDLEETPNTNSTKDWNGQVVVPAEDVDDFTGRGDEAGPDAHDSQGQGAGNAGLLGEAQGLGEGAGEGEGALEEEALVAGLGPNGGGEPGVEEVGRSHADEECGGRAGEGLAAAEAGSVASPETAKGAGRRVAPAEQHDTHDGDILGEGVQDDPRTEEVEDDPVPARVLALAHQGAQDLDVEAVEGRIPVPKPVDRGDGYQGGHQPRCHGASLGAGNVEPDDEEADGDVEHLSWHLVLMDEGAPVSVYRDEAEGARTAAEVAPAPTKDAGGLRRGEMAV